MHEKSSQPEKKKNTLLWIALGALAFIGIDFRNN
jgi:hypothetical protein